MHLRVRETQQLFSDSVRGFLGDRAPFERLRAMEGSAQGFDVELWAAMVDQGWTEVAFAEAGGLDLAHLGTLLEELGRACVASPLFQSVAAAGVTTLRLGDTARAASLVGEIARGARAALVAPAEARRVPRVVLAQGQLRVDGGPFLVEWADTATALVCPVRHDDGTFGMVALDPGAPGVRIEPRRAFDHERIGRVVLDGALSGTSDVVREASLTLDELRDALALVSVLRCVEMSGGIRRVLEMTVDYVAAREQFGRPIGSFQAVQHACADMRMESDGAFLTSWQALSRAEAGLPFRRQAAIAAYFVGRAYERVTLSAAQLHGGIGFMADYDLQLYFRRAKAQRLRLGTEQHQLESVARDAVDPIARGEATA